MRLSCSTRSFPLDNLKLSLARIQWAGYTAAEVTLADDSSGRPEGGAVQEALERNEMELSAVDAEELEFGSPDQALESAARIGRCAVLAHGADGSRVVFSPVAGALEHLAFGLRHLAGAMPAYRVTLCPINSVDGLLTDPEHYGELRRLLETPEAVERLGLALDPAAAVNAGYDPLQFVAAAGVPLSYVYLTDTLRGLPALPGEGDLDWEQLVSGLRALGYDGYLSLRLAGTDPLYAETDAKEICAYMGALIYRAQ